MKDFLLLILFVASIGGAVTVAVIMGINEGMAYQKNQDARTIANCNEIIVGAK